MKIIGVIPARYKSTRFEGKPLADICGHPMIWWVYRQVTKVSEFDSVIVATDDVRIEKFCIDNNINVMMTSNENETGTDRVAEVAKRIEGDIFVNIQGDEPLIEPKMIKELIVAFNDKSVYYATLKKQIMEEKKKADPNIVKVITDCNGDAIYFSRSLIPYNRTNLINGKVYKHVGIYAYKRDFLIKITQLKQTPLEIIESLEQLRAIENNYKLRVVETKYDSVGVDLPEHIKLVEENINNRENER